MLLKNEEGLLPLAGSGKTIAVIGPDRARTRRTADIDAASVCSPPRPGALHAASDTARQHHRTARRPTAARLTYADGGDPRSAAATAAAADVAIVFGYYREGEFADRPNMSLDGNGDALISAVAAANPNTVMVLQTGGPVRHAMDRLGRRACSRSGTPASRWVRQSPTCCGATWRRPASSRTPSR